MKTTEDLISSAAAKREAWTVPELAKFEPLLTPPAAAKLLLIHEKTLIRMAREGTVPAIRLGKHWRFRASQLNTWVIAKSAQDVVVDSTRRSA